MASEMMLEAKNVEKAVKKASAKYNIPAEKLKYEVITYGSTGIFGLVGVKKAKIRVILPDEKLLKKDPVKAKLAEKKPIEKKRIEKKRVEKKPVEKKPVDAEVETIEKPKPPLPEELIQYANDPIALGKNVLQKILDMITVEATIEVMENEDSVLFNVKGGKAAVLIGKRGQTLEAIQYLVEKIVNRHSEKRTRLQIDVQGYLENRKTNLEELANRLAEKSARIGKPVTVGEMNVHDRKIVHMALKDHRQVRTQSMGSGFYRKLMIFPKKNGQRKRNNNPRNRGNQG